MGYQLFIWEGIRPGSDSAAAVEVDELAHRYLLGDRVPVTSAIRLLARAVARQWSGEDRIGWWDDDWLTFSSIMAAASGPVLHLDLPMPRASMVSCIVAALVEEQGLVCWDPQVAMLRPVPEAVADACMRRFADRLGREPTSDEILTTMGIAADAFDEELTGKVGTTPRPYTPVRRPTASRRRRPR